MNYNFDGLDSRSFEQMIRSLAEGCFGIKCRQYGDGPDGQREFAYSGEIRDKAGTVFSGLTIGQAKYKSPIGKESDYQWIKKQLKNELDNFKAKDKEDVPDNYFFYTNIVLTPVHKTGIKDRIDKFIEPYKEAIPNIYVLGYDEICALLDNNRDVATAYASYITTGDVLQSILNHEDKMFNDTLKDFIFYEFKDDMYTRMEQAGSLTDEKISIEKVCVDIDVEDKSIGQNMKFARIILSQGNQLSGYRVLDSERDDIDINDFSGNYVLIGGPGKGKSTLCQYIAQIYRAKYLADNNEKISEAEAVLNEIKQNYGYDVNCRRIPIKIVLRDYAAWIKEQSNNDNTSVIEYMCVRIKKHTGVDVSTSQIKTELAKHAWIFFFDGLDEVPESSNRNQVMRELDLFFNYELKKAKCDSIIVGTTRQQGYNNEFENLRFKLLEIQELSEEDCRLFFVKLFSIIESNVDKREEYVSIMNEALADETTSKLMKTPLQVTIIAILVKSGGKPPHERYSLFKQYYETMIKREKQKGVIVTLNDNTDWLEEIHLILAYRLQVESENEANPSAEIEKQQLQEVIKKYIRDTKDDDYAVKQDLEETIFRTITERICFLNESRDNFYSFSVRSIQEFFAGTYIVKGKKDEDVINSLSKIAVYSYWRNVILFSLGYISLEKSYLIDSIVGICDNLNGRNDISEDDFSINKICLFGSWLAVDILAEDIFKGRDANKFIDIAGQGIVNSNTKNFAGYRNLRNVPRNKFVRHIKTLKEDGKIDKKDLACLYSLMWNIDEFQQEAKELLTDEESKLFTAERLLDYVPDIDTETKKQCIGLLLDVCDSKYKNDRMPSNIYNAVIDSGLDYKDMRVKRFLLRQSIMNSRFCKGLFDDAETNDAYEFFLRVFRQDSTESKESKWPLQTIYLFGQWIGTGIKII